MTKTQLKVINALLNEKSHTEINHESIIILICDYTKKPMLNYYEAMSVMKQGKKTQIFDKKDSHQWIEYSNGDFHVMTDKGLVKWEPTPTVAELQFDCFVVL